MSDDPQKAPVESSSACRSRLLEESTVVSPDSCMQEQEGNSKELSRLGFPSFELTQDTVAASTQIQAEYRNSEQASTDHSGHEKPASS